ncbi:MAG: PilZ domain-containing protein [Phycisphaerae bacterium]|nr:PilZ domain-containing protein [Phycisphaerae bacterium]
MKIEEILKLTPKRVAILLKTRRKLAGPSADLYAGQDLRRSVRWPFPGQVELWPAGGDGRERFYATCHNLSTNGLGMIADASFEPGTRVELACHFPEASFYGKGVIRHCTKIPKGYLIGLQFDFEE